MWFVTGYNPHIFNTSSDLLSSCLRSNHYKIPWVGLLLPCYLLQYQTLIKRPQTPNYMIIEIWLCQLVNLFKCEMGLGLKEQSYQ